MTANLIPTAPGVFNWPNRQWAETRLPFVRLASVVMADDERAALTASMSEAEAEGFAMNLMNTANHLRDLADICDAAADKAAAIWDAAHPDVSGKPSRRRNRNFCATTPSISL
jgi:hypothetical protein